MTSTRKYLYTYSGYTGQGQLVNGEVRAQNIEWARHKLRRQGLRVNSIKRAFQLPFSQHKAIVPEDIASFTQQLAMLTKVGIPLSKSFAILASNCNKNIMKMLIEEIRDDISTGDSFSKALRKHPQQFDDLFCNMVAAAELSGELGTVLQRISNYQERSEKLKRHIKKALTYPCMVLLVAILVTGILLTKVVPEFARTFAEFGAELPTLTLFVLKLSELIQSLWLYSLISCIAVCGSFYLVLKRSKKISQLKDKTLLKLPIIGNLLRHAILARFARTLATTFNAGLPIMDALRSAATTTGNSQYTQSILDLRQDLAHGVSLHQAISKQTVFPLALQQMILVGEESGTLGKILDRAGEFYEQDLQLSLDTITQLIEPIIMLVLGLVVGGLLLAMYLPIFQIGSII